MIKEFIYLLEEIQAELNSKKKLLGNFYVQSTKISYYSMELLQLDSLSAIDGINVNSLKGYYQY